MRPLGLVYMMARPLFRAAICALTTAESEEVCQKRRNRRFPLRGTQRDDLLPGLRVPGFEPRDDWERRLFEAATDCGVSVSHEAVSSEGLYE